jgi:long-chain acyl-CoA synthetase
MEKIWIDHYQPGVPADIGEPIYTSLTDMFEKSCKQYASHPAYSNLGTQLTYQELETKTLAFAAFLQQRLLLKKGDRFAIMMPNILQYPVVLFGALRAGLTIVNLNPLYTAVELIPVLQDSGAKAIVILANFTSALQEALPKTAVEHVIVTEVGDLFPVLKKIAVNFVVKYIKKMIPIEGIKGAYYFNDVLNQGKQLTFKSPTVTSEYIAFLQYTGGTTGIPKGAVLTHGNLIANIMQLLCWVKPVLKFGEEVIITPLPLYHIFSLTTNCLLFCAIGGLSVLITNPRDIPAFITELKQTKFTAICGVNTLFYALLKNPEFTKINAKNLRFSIAGGMAISQTVADQWYKITGNVIIEGYGLTEASPVVAVNPLNTHAFTGSVGLPLPSTDVSIRDERNQEVPLGKTGELCVKGPQVMKGYWQSTELSHQTFTPDGWLRTGDVARMNEQGYIYLVDRIKDMILISGFNVYPHEIEEVIAKHQSVAEVAVIGIPDERTGEAIKAFIVKKDESLSQQEILDLCHKFLTPYKIPRVIEFIAELPKSPVGKILKKQLKEPRTS